MRGFNPRSPARERRPDVACLRAGRLMFQSTLPREGATATSKPPRTPTLFQSTLPREGATIGDLRPRYAILVSIHAPPRGSDGPAYAGARHVAVSIHAPPRGSDEMTMMAMFHSEVSIHAPPRRERPAKAHRCACPWSFQSTLPREGATPTRHRDGGAPMFQSTLPREGATLQHPFPALPVTVSIHAPPRGSDVSPSPTLSALSCFNPRSPARERRPGFTPWPATWSFNPRSPARERQVHNHFLIGNIWFQSTLPREGATQNFCRA